ncbi:MAG: hypothetical protein R3F19_18415 [Verrucomicrobiales bacterium]
MSIPLTSFPTAQNGTIISAVNRHYISTLAKASVSTTTILRAMAMKTGGPTNAGHAVDIFPAEVIQQTE